MPTFRNTVPFSQVGSLPSTACFCTQTRPYPVTLLPIGSGYFRIKPFPILIPQQFSNLVHSSHLPASEDGTECSETLAYKIQKPGNYPEESIQLAYLYVFQSEVNRTRRGNAGKTVKLVASCSAWCVPCCS
jgi:hypothetical protein